jgi:serine/threonine protein kinase
MAHKLVAKVAVDLEALSPRDANAQRFPKAADIKTKVAAQLKPSSSVGKEHPPPPPEHVIEPPSFNRQDGAVYQSGKLLGKGGFAICYVGQLLPTRQKYALKIVKSQMPSKMEQKVRAIFGNVAGAQLILASVPNRASDSLQDEA